jgi:predicted phosphodiesterase
MTEARLKPHEAKMLGIPEKPRKEGQKGNPKYTITDQQYEEVEKTRPLKVKTSSKTNPNNYKQSKRKVLSAWGDDGVMMDIDTYCVTYKLPRTDITSYKLITHTGTPFYNTVFKEKDGLNNDFDYIGELEKQLKGIKPIFLKSTGDKTGVATLTDMHFGAYISAMNITPEFSIKILCRMFNNAADKINRFNYKTVHLHLLGDLIESFTGMNHKNSWKGLDKGMFGVSAIRLFVELFKEHFLDRVNNLGKIKMVAGNHDRVTSDSTEDTDGGAAELVAWGLKLLGYDVEFKRDVLVHIVDGICYILNHGHLSLTNKKTTQEICWMYGEKGLFNFIMEGHLHSRIAKLNAKQVSNFKMVSDDNIDCRRQVCPSFFTGNSFSEDGGWSTLPGFTISEASEITKGVDVYDISL